MWSKVRDFIDGVDKSEGADEPVTLALALKRNWLELFYQPKVTLRDARIVGAEGLIRVRHPARGVLTPNLFLPGAGEAEMLALTERVILAALRDWEIVASAGAAHVTLAVNVPAFAFARLPVAKMVRDARPKSAEWPGLILEVTEDQVVNNLQMANEVARELEEQKCSLAIDDFGAGYSSLSRLRELPFSELKIDRAYVTNCHRDQVSAGMLESIIALARRSGLKTVAEGIETAHESHKLQALGCAVGQGFLFARPMPKDEFVARVGTRAPRSPEPRKWWQPSAA
jgi:EAL domain-containing protein (putative c-di-GMP-specific phosphodiesterase class I)